jgi:uncharacterized protein
MNTVLSLKHRLALFFTVSVLSATFAQQKPNILFILVDDLAYNDIGCYAYPGNLVPSGRKVPSPYPERSAYAAPNQAAAMVNGQIVSITPNLDRLASQGVKFTNYHSPSSVCSPSRLGLITGRMPARFGLGGIISEKRGDTFGLPSREVTMSEALKGAGYATAAFGKWHLGNGEQFNPTRHGFDRYWPATGERATELERLTNQVLNFIEENRSEPFFAYFAPHQPHHPNIPHPDFAGSSTKLLGPRSYMKGDGTTDLQSTSASDYHDVVHELDFRIGLLLKKLDELDLSKNTIVIFTSDNGPWTGQTGAKAGKPGIIGTGYPYRGGKFELWDGGTRVPALIRFPKEIPAGVVSDAPVSGLDWFKTLILRGGGEVPADRKLDGFDLWSFLTNLPEAQSPRPFVPHERGKTILALSNGQFKQFDNRLVDLQTDFTELVDVKSGQVDLSNEMLKELADANASLAEEILELEKGSSQDILLDTGGENYVRVHKGGIATFRISLQNAPEKDIVVEVRQRSGTPNLKISPASLTFTSTDWKTPKNVSIKSENIGDSSSEYATLEVEGLDTMPIKEVFLHTIENPHKDCIPQAYAFAVVKPVDLSDAKITGDYLGAYVERTRDVGILDLFAKMEKRGSFKNFRIVVEGLPDKHVGGFNEDEWVHKLVEAAGFFAPQSKVIHDTFQPLIHDILASQAEDGYLQTYYQNPAYLKDNGPDVRFRKGGRHEFYVFGHLAQAGMAWKRTTGDDRLFQASLRYADLLCSLFGSKPLPYDYQSDRPDRKYEHPNHEMAMVELYRMTGNRRYLDFAAHTLDYYKFWSFPEVWGHCVMENLLLCGGADVYLETGKPGMLRHLDAMWTDITERKAYLTGGVGDGSPLESYGPAYSLPNDKSYCETCAAISKVFFNERMLLATGQARYAHDMERTFYNAVLSGVSLTGTEYFYENAMEINIEGKDPGKYGRREERKPYHNTSCCAPNLHRLLGSFQQYLFTTSKEGVQAQLYGSAELKTRLESGALVHLRETTDYPRSGSVQFEILTDGKYDLSLRIPQWTEGTKVSTAINGRPGDFAQVGEYIKIDQAWKAGDKVTLEFDMKPRIINGREWVAAEKGKVALMRGPVVYCLESPDNKGIDIFHLALSSDAGFTEKPTAELGGTVRLNGQAWDSVNKQAVQVSAVPYQLWANRGASSMRIWIPARDGN